MREPNTQIRRELVTPLKAARIRRGITPEHLAVAVGVTRPTISRIENGQKRPSPELTIRIAEYFGPAITRDQIMFPEKYSPKNRRLKKAS